MRATANAQCMEVMKNMRTEKYLSTLPSHIVNHSFIITLSVSRSRISAFSKLCGVNGRSSVLMTKKNHHHLFDNELELFQSCKCGRRRETGAKCAVHKDETCFLCDPTWAQDVCV